jgi:hypothetical protein
MTTTKKVAGDGLSIPAFLARTGKAKVKPAATPAPAPIEVAPPPAPAKPAKRRRRRRRASAQVVAAKTMADIKRKERQFLREVSAMLTEALGFPVRVSHVKVAPPPMTPRMGRFARMPKAEARRQIAEAFAPLNDSVADL